VRSLDREIDCGLDCSEVYPVGTTVLLATLADAGSLFVGWSGDCDATNPCSVTMSATRKVTARFDVAPDAPPPDPGTCDPASFVQHTNGVGGRYYSCTPLGTYTQQSAIDALKSWTGASYPDEFIRSGQCGGGSFVVYAMNGAHQAAVWAYSGGLEGHVHLENTGMPVCPTISDPTWQ